MLDGSQVNQSAVARLVKKQQGAQHPWRLLSCHPPPPLPIPPPTFITVKNPSAREQIYRGDCSFSLCVCSRISHEGTGRGTQGQRGGKSAEAWGGGCPAGRDGQVCAVRGVLGAGGLPQPPAYVKALLFCSVARETPQRSDPRPSQSSAESPHPLCCRGKISAVMDARTMAI